MNITNAFSPVWVADGLGLTPSAPAFIGISRDGVVWDLIPKANMSIGQVFSASPGQYPYKTMTKLILIPHHGNRIEIELQVEQNLGENTGLQTDLNDAVITVGSWLI